MEVLDSVDENVVADVVTIQKNDISKHDWKTDFYTYIIQD